MTELDAKLKAKYNFSALTLEDLAKVHLELATVLDEKISREINQFRDRAEQLQSLAQNILAVDKPPERPKRARVATSKAPKDGAESAEEPGEKSIEAVFYRNPDNHEQTWNGTGRQPKWVKKLMNEGTPLETLKVSVEVKPEEETPPVEAVEEKLSEEEKAPEPKPVEQGVWSNLR